eukprot:253345-Hanusia_phi.AAC.1
MLQHFAGRVVLERSTSVVRREEATRTSAAQTWRCPGADMEILQGGVVQSALQNEIAMMKMCSHPCTVKVCTATNTWDEY